MTKPPNLDHLPYLPDAPIDDGVLMAPAGIGPATLRKLRSLDAATLRAMLSPHQIQALRPEAMTPREAALDNRVREEEQAMARSFITLANVVFRHLDMHYAVRRPLDGDCGEGSIRLIAVCPHCRSTAIRVTAGDACEILEVGGCMAVFTQVQCHNPACGKTSTLSISADECGLPAVSVHTSTDGDEGAQP